MKLKHHVALMAASVALLAISIPVQASKIDDRIESSARNSYVFKNFLQTETDIGQLFGRQVRDEKYRAHFGDKLFRTIIPRNVRLAEAPSYGRTIYEHDRWSKGARSYKALSREIQNRLR